jgi:flagellar biosynthesis/type III secretory pathway chaperone
MSTGPAFSAAIPSPAPVATAAEAEALIAHFTGVMEALVGVVQQETELVRAGRLAQAGEFGQRKGELTRSYIADTLRLRASHSRLAQIVPADRLEALRRRHDTFRALLQLNLTVLATAHAVSEGIVRGVSGEMARKSAPQTYGASGRANGPSRNAAAPLAVSRVL